MADVSTVQASKEPTVHECHCTYCWDFKLPADVQRLGHVGFRFHNTRADIGVTLNGEDVATDCVEACPGVDGYVVVYPRDLLGHKHYCEACHRHVCMAVKHGLVRVTITSEVFE